MLIKEIHLTEGMYHKDVIFQEGINHIYSHHNSCGKTTLLRLILHGLGFTVPDLNELTLDKCQVKLIIVSGNNVYNTSRNGRYLVVEKNNSESQTYILPRQSNDVLREILQINNNSLIECVLGSMYIDQDRGWSLLNRGKVLGKNSFDIDRFISSFSDDNLISLVEKRSALFNEQKRYKTLISLFDRQRTLENYSTERIDLSVLEALQIDLITEKVNLSYLKKEEKRLRQSLNDNQKFLQYIDQMKLVLCIDGREMPLTHDMIVSCPDSLNLINSRLNIIKAKIEKSKEIVSDCEDKINRFIKEKQTEQIVESFSVIPLSKTELNPLEIQSSIDVMKESIEEMDAEIKELMNNSTIVYDIDSYIERNSKYLGVYDYIENKKPHCLIKELKTYSGTDYKKIILSYRLAYLSVIEEKYNVILPIIIDSPKNEVDDENLNLMVDLLNKYYKKHQILIASIDSIPTANNIIELQSSKKLIDVPRKHHSLDQFTP